jgi:hypothetical protein
MKLTQHTLPQYFSIADSTNSWHSLPTNTFDFIERNSQDLVVTIGDSWTWGSDISLHNQNNQTRIDNLYGNIIAERLGADFLNLALCAQGNFWIASMASELANIIPSLEYKHIYVVCTFTGVTRWFNTCYDLHINYSDWFNNTAPDFDQLLVMLNQHCVDSIITDLCKYKNVTLKMGTNFVDQLAFNSLRPDQILPVPWYKLLGCNDSESVYTCLFYERISTAMEFIQPQYHYEYKQWLLELIDKSSRRLQLLADPATFRNYHPLAAGHQVWAKYILKELTPF